MGWRMDGTAKYQKHQKKSRRKTLIPLQNSSQIFGWKPEILRLFRKDVRCSFLKTFLLAPSASGYEEIPDIFSRLMYILKDKYRLYRFLFSYLCRKILLSVSETCIFRLLLTGKDCSEELWKPVPRKSLPALLPGSGHKGVFFPLSFSFRYPGRRKLPMSFQYFGSVPVFS